MAFRNKPGRAPVFLHRLTLGVRQLGDFIESGAFNQICFCMGLPASGGIASWDEAFVPMVLNRKAFGEINTHHRFLFDLSDTSYKFEAFPLFLFSGQKKIFSSLKLETEWKGQTPGGLARQLRPCRSAATKRLNASPPESVPMQCSRKAEAFLITSLFIFTVSTTSRT